MCSKYTDYLPEAENFLKVAKILKNLPVFWNPTFEKCVYKRRPLYLLGIQINLAHKVPLYSFKICFTIIPPNWLFMTPSIATKFQYVSFLFIFFLTHYMFRPLRAIFR
jgi:hypothetical protein